jgi:pimeloyl-ACP methyl ester carboxylesterase
VFQALDLKQPIHFLDWMPPLPGESITDYAWRMWERIPDSEPVLFGLSFGGVMAQEMARLKPCKALILLSTICQPSELPWHMKAWRHLPLYQLSRGSWRIKTLPLWAPAFGIHKPFERQLLREMFQGFSDEARMWAIETLVHWSGQAPELGSLPHVRIHGNKDRVFPPKQSFSYGSIQWIQGGRHFCVLQEAVSVSKIVQQFLQTL